MSLESIVDGLIKETIQARDDISGARLVRKLRELKEEAVTSIKEELAIAEDWVDEVPLEDEDDAELLTDALKPFNDLDDDDRLRELVETSPKSDLTKFLKRILDRLRPERKPNMPPLHWYQKRNPGRHPSLESEWDAANEKVGEFENKDALKRLYFAIDYDDPHAPKQMALVLRFDLARLLSSWGTRRTQSSYLDDEYVTQLLKDRLIESMGEEAGSERAQLFIDAKVRNKRWDSVVLRDLGLKEVTVYEKRT